MEEPPDHLDAVDFIAVDGGLHVDGGTFPGTPDDDHGQFHPPAVGQAADADRRMQLLPGAGGFAAAVKMGQGDHLLFPSIIMAAPARDTIGQHPAWGGGPWFNPSVPWKPTG